MIEREIPKEIMDFNEKICFGLTLRQVICVIVSAVLCIPTYIFARKVLGEEITSWLVLIEAAPCIAIGFFKYQGIPFEKMIKRLGMQLFLLPSKRKYKISNFFEEILKEKEDDFDITLEDLEKEAAEREAAEQDEDPEENPEDSNDKKKPEKKNKKEEKAKLKAKKAEEKRKLQETKKRRNAKSKLPAKQKTAPKGEIPRTSQQSVPYIADYDNGLFEISPGKYSKCFDFKDVNYQVARIEDQANIFLKWGDFLNYFGSDVSMSYTIYNKPENEDSLLKKIMIDPLPGNEEDVKNFNRMLKKQFKVGRNDIKKDKYITVTINAEDPYEAEDRFIKIENEISKLMSRTGSELKLQSTERRLGILHDFYRPLNTGELELDWDFIKQQGLSSKDYIAPSGIEFKSDRVETGDMLYQCCYLTNLPARMGDNIMTALTDFNFQLLTTTSLVSVDTEKAIRIVKRKITGMESMKMDAQKKAIRSGFDPELAINHELKLSMEEAVKLLENLQSNNQRMFFTTIGIIIFGKTMEELEINKSALLSKVRGCLCQLQPMKWQQEDGIKQLLPLGHNVLPLKRTLTTESLSVFLPFTSQELNDKNGIYYSLNQVTKNIIRVDRKKLNNPNGFIIGESGSGKSFMVKKALLSYYLSRPNQQIYIIDPENEYERLVTKIGGQVVKIGVGSDNHINICDMSKNYSTDGDPIAEKADYLMSVCESMARGLSAAQQSIVDHVTGQIYADYIQNYDENKLPTFVDFYEKINEQEEKEAKDLALALRTYATGSLSIFAKKTNVDLKNRLVCFDISGLGTNLQNVGLLVVSEMIWNKLCENRNKIETSVWIDEFHLMFKTATSENFADQLFARIRKYGGEVTGITQNIDKLLQSEKARGMLGNSLFTIMLSQSDTNRKILADMFSIGEDQLSYITNGDKGTGLIRAAGTIVPFADVFPKDNKLYRYMTSDPNEIKQFDEEEAREKEETKTKRSMVMQVASGE